MLGRRLTAALLLALAAAVPAAAQENPLQFFKRLIAPPARAISETFRPTLKPNVAVAAPPLPSEVPVPQVRPDHEGITVGAAADDPPSADEKMAPEAPVAAADAEMPVPSAPSAAALTVPPPAVAVPSAVAEAEDIPGPLLSYAPPDGPSPFDALIPTPRERPVHDGFAALPPLVKPPPAARSTCGAALAMVGVNAEAMAPISEGGGCGIAAPVAVTSFADGDVTLTETAVIDCGMAERVAGWLDDVVQPAARSVLGGPVTGLRVAASYSCRNRNNLAATKLSEHAKGNAIDISAFRVNGRWIEVGQVSGDDQRFLAKVRKAACGPFTTVLGPGSDSYHSDHFHLDQAKRRTAGPSKGLYCH